MLMIPFFFLNSKNNHNKIKFSLPTILAAATTILAATTAAATAAMELLLF